jgi:hypothetical protein
MSLKNSNDTIGNRTGDLAFCSVVPNVLTTRANLRHDNWLQPTKWSTVFVRIKVYTYSNLLAELNFKINRTKPSLIHDACNTPKFFISTRTAATSPGNYTRLLIP